MSLPHGGRREDAIHTKVFEKYIRDHVVSWFNWARDIGLPVERTEDICFVYGRTMTTSWAAAAFDDYAADAQISLANEPLNNGGVSFQWSNIRGIVEYHDSQLDPVCSLLCKFIRHELTLLSLKEWPVFTRESLRIHQMLPSKAHIFLDQTPPG